MLDSPSAEAGWYPDPSGAHRYRYWDGHAWTSTVSEGMQDAQAATPPPLPPQPPPLPQLLPPVVPRSTRRPRRRLIATTVIVGVLLLSGAAAATMTLLRPEPGPRDLAAIVVRSNTVDLTWMAPPGPPVDLFVLSRDGQDVATLENTTRYEDRDLSPRTGYHYTVRAVRSGTSTAPSAELVVRTPPWGASELHDVGTSSTSARFGWEPPIDGPPDEYVVQRDGIDLATIEGSATSYTDTTAPSGRYLHYTVLAVREGMRSDPSAPVELHTVDRLVADARLDGAWDVSITVTENHGTRLRTGQTTAATWSFSPACSGGSCDLTVDGTLTDLPFTVKLTRRGARYTGSLKTPASRCAQKVVTDTLTFSLTVTEGDLAPGYWAAADWSARVSVLMPYTAIGNRYCPEQSVVFTVVPQVTGGSGEAPHQTVSLRREPERGSGRFAGTAWQPELISIR